MLRRSLGNSNVSVLLSECSVTVLLSNRNRSRYYYLVWESFKWLFLLYHLINCKLSLLKYERSKTWFIALMNHALTSDHLPGSICVHPLDHLELRLDLLPSAVSTTQGRRASATQGRRASTTQGRPGRSWCWRPKSQAWPRPASRLSHRSPRLLQWLSFVEREDSPLAPPPPDRKRRWFASNFYKLVLKHSAWLATAHKQYIELLLQEKLVLMYRGLCPSRYEGDWKLKMRHVRFEDERCWKFGWKQRMTQYRDYMTNTWPWHYNCLPS